MAKRLAYKSSSGVMQPVNFSRIKTDTFSYEYVITFKLNEFDVQEKKLYFAGLKQQNAATQIIMQMHPSSRVTKVTCASRS